MRQLRHRILFATGLLLATACAGPAQLSPAHGAAMQDSVRSALADLHRHAAASQWHSLLTLYADEAGFRWVEEGEVKARSVAQTRGDLRRLPPGMRVETTFRDMEVSPLVPGAASVVTGFETSLADSAGTRFSFGGTLTTALVHRAGGWQIVTGHSSSPVRGSP
jgi:hypothetical protein